MGTVRITKRTVDAASEGLHWDSEVKGFGLRVSAGGTRNYILQSRIGSGRASPSVRITIGKHGSPWNPTSAREEALRLLTLTRQGVDPREDRKARQRIFVDLAFEPYSQRFLEGYARVEWKSSYAFAEGILRLHVSPILGRTPLPSITRRHITEVLDAIPVTQTALRKNVYAVMRRLFRWALGRGDIERSPFEGLTAPPSARSRDRTLTDTELATVWAASSKLGYPFGPMVRLLIASGQRREEVAGLGWAELDRRERLWILPADRAKNGKAHLVPLNGHALTILDDLAGGEVWPTTGFVFTTTGRTPVSGHSRAKGRLDDEIAKLLVELDEDAEPRIPMAPWRLHDLRRTVATGLQRLGVRFEVTESVLNHVSGSRSGVAGVYQRHDWAGEKRDALEAWGRHLASIEAFESSEVSQASNVVTLIKTARAQR